MAISHSIDSSSANPAMDFDGTERWIPIHRSEGRYEVSDMGRVRSFAVPGKPELRRDHPIILKPARHSKGYMAIFLWALFQNKKRFFVHRLVLEAFVGDAPSDLHEAAHLNGVRSDNRLCNLKWVLHKENESHKKIHGTLLEGEKNGFSKLMNWQVSLLKYLRQRGFRRSQIASLLGVDTNQLKYAIQGICWNSIDPLKEPDEIQPLLDELRRLRRMWEIAKKTMWPIINRERGRLIHKRGDIDFTSADQKSLDEMQNLADQYLGIVVPRAEFPELSERLKGLLDTPEAKS